jgi:hypothetical protein
MHLRAPVRPLCLPRCIPAVLPHGLPWPNMRGRAQRAGEYGSAGHVASDGSRRILGAHRWALCRACGQRWQRPVLSPLSPWFRPSHLAHICPGTRARLCHICPGTRARPCHISTGAHRRMARDGRREHRSGKHRGFAHRVTHTRYRTHMRYRTHALSNPRVHAHACTHRSARALAGAH